MTVYPVTTNSPREAKPSDESSLSHTTGDYFFAIHRYLVMVCRKRCGARFAARLGG